MGGGGEKTRSGRQSFVGARKRNHPPKGVGDGTHLGKELDQSTSKNG